VIEMQCVWCVATCPTKAYQHAGLGKSTHMPIWPK